MFEICYAIESPRSKLLRVRVVAVVRIAMARVVMRSILEPGLLGWRLLVDIWPLRDTMPIQPYLYLECKTQTQCNRLPNVVYKVPLFHVCAEK
jgi:hypothetical protein